MPIDLLDIRLGESGEVTFDASVCAREPVARQLPRLPPSWRFPYMIEAAAFAEPIESFLCFIWWAAINIFVFCFYCGLLSTSLSLPLWSRFERTFSTVFLRLPTKMTEPSRVSSTEEFGLLILNTCLTTLDSSF